MKILHCITGLSGDGAQRMLLRLVQGLEGQGVSNTVVSLGGPGQLAPDFEALGVPVVALGISGPASLVPGVLKLRKALDVHRPDLLQGWMYHANILALLSQETRGVRLPVVWNIRRGLDDLAQRKAATRAAIRASAWVSPRASRIIYCSEQSREQHEGAGFSSSAATVLGNGFDTRLFAPSVERRRAFRDELGIGDEDFVVGQVGRFDLAKGHRFLFEAFGAFATRHPRARLVCIGRGVEGAMLDAVVASDVSRRVHLLPERQKIFEVFPGFDLYCSSSVAEGFPNVVAEALCCGLPVVATDTGATRDLLGTHGVLVKPRSSEALLGGLLQVMSEPEHQRRSRGVMGRYFIEREHSVGRVVHSYGRLYEDAVRSGFRTRTDKHR